MKANVLLLLATLGGAPLGSACGSEPAPAAPHETPEPTTAEAGAAGAAGTPASLGGEGGVTVGGQAAEDGGGSAEAAGAAGAPGAGGARANVCAEETRTVDYAPSLKASGSLGMTVTLVSSVPGPPVVGNNVWELLIEDEAGQPVVGAEVAVTPFMPDHRHGSPLAVVVTEGSDGYYRAKPLNFSMPGYWNTRVQVVTDTWQDTAAFKLCMAGQ